MKTLIHIIKKGSDYGTLILLIGLLLGVPLLVLPFYPEETQFLSAFLIPMLASVVLGFVICLLTYRRKADDTGRQRGARRGSFLIVFIWLFSFVMGALPFVIAGQLDFVRALFESVSGWTTTGLSVMDVTATPHIFLLHRSFMQYAGGLGFVLMITMLIQGKHSMSLYSAEGHPDMIRPSLRQTSRQIAAVYGGSLVLGTILYRVFGMKVFDAICHTMSALSTAGFTTKAGSIGEFNSLPIEIITILLMLVGASNFAVLVLLAKGKLRSVFRVTETRVMIVLISVFTALSVCRLAAELGFLNGLRQAVFGVVTVFTTTGYSLTNYAVWPPFVVGLLILLMIVGGSSGSTAGGIKLSRTYFLLRITRENIRKRLSPANKTAAPTYNGVRGKIPIDGPLIADTFGFIASYMGILILGTLLLTLTADCSIQDALFEFASAFGTVGISNGLTHAGTNVPTLIVEMVGMTLGRLEIFVVFFGLLSGARWAVGKVRREE